MYTAEIQQDFCMLPEDKNWWCFTVTFSPETGDVAIHRGGYGILDAPPSGALTELDDSYLDDAWRMEVGREWSVETDDVSPTSDLEAYGGELVHSEFSSNSIRLLASIVVDYGTWMFEIIPVLPEAQLRAGWTLADGSWANAEAHWGPIVGDPTSSSSSKRK